MTRTLSEIRMNEFWAIHSASEYDDSASSDSKPISNKRVIRSDVLFEKLRNLIKQSPIDYKVDHLFPPNCRYFEKHPNGYFVVIEEPPSFRTLTLDKDISNEIESLKNLGLLEKYGYQDWLKTASRPYRFTVAIPYTIFFLTYMNTHDILQGRVFFRTKPMSGFSDPLFITPFPNISNNQNICFGDKINQGPKTSIFSAVNHTISIFWNAEFNIDYIYNYEAYQNVPGVCDWLTWEHYSNHDPMFIYTAEWIHHKGLTIGDEVEKQKRRLKEDRDDDDTSRYSFYTLRSLFNEPKDEGKAEIKDSDGIVMLEDVLLYDVNQTMVIDNTTVNVGDQLKDKKERMYNIDSFLGFRRQPEPLFVSLNRDDGRVIRLKLNDKSKEFIKTRIEAERYIAEYKLPNGDVLTSGSIMCFTDSNGNNVHRKIKYIRTNAVGEIEISAGSEYYIADNLPSNCYIMDLNNLEYFGSKLSIGNSYIVYINNDATSSPIVRVSECILEDITTNIRQNLIYKFKTPGGTYIKIPVVEQNTFKRVFIKEELQVIDSPFVLGRAILHCCSSENRDIKMPVYFIKDIGAVGVYADTRIAGLSDIHLDDDMDICDTLIKDDILHIKSPDLDIDFKIGDKVVTANWENPIDMLTVKQIQGFVVNKDSGDISFTLIDKNENVTNFQYINIFKSSIRTGAIRKITNIWHDLSAGMKITANKAGISMFPKKDTNIIVGFLYDTGGPEPLVLCSNGCTLWYSDVIEKFNIIKITDPKWKENKHAPIKPSKIRYQPGDILKSKRYYRNNFGYMAFKPPDERILKATNLKYYASYADAYVFDKGFSNDVYLDCFPNPRVTPKVEKAMSFTHGYSNFHGMFRSTSSYNSPYMIINDKRSIINVPSDN